MLERTRTCRADAGIRRHDRRRRVAGEPLRAREDRRRLSSMRPARRAHRSRAPRPSPWCRENAAVEPQAVPDNARHPAVEHRRAEGARPRNCWRGRSTTAPVRLRSAVIAGIASTLRSARPRWRQAGSFRWFRRDGAAPSPSGGRREAGCQSSRDSTRYAVRCHAAALTGHHVTCANRAAAVRGRPPSQEQPRRLASTRPHRPAPPDGDGIDAGSSVRSYPSAGIAAARCAPPDRLETARAQATQPAARARARVELEEPGGTVKQPQPTSQR